MANVVELQAILERIQPDVIFAEIPSANVDQYCDGSHGNLESMAVSRYLRTRQVAVIPIDLAKPEEEFFRNAQEMFRKVERTSADYRRLMDSYSVDTRIGGFPYLNSDRCIRVWAAIHDEVLATLNWIRNARLREIYDLWCQTNERRDHEMTQSIVRYCLRNAGARGAFLVGAAHRKSITDKAFAASRTGSPRIEWDHTDFLG